MSILRFDTDLVINKYVSLFPSLEYRGTSEARSRWLECVEYQAWKLSSMLDLRVVPPWTWHVTLANSREWRDLRESGKPMTFPDFKLEIENKCGLEEALHDLEDRTEVRWNLLADWEVVTDLQGRMSLRLRVDLSGGHAWRGNLGLPWHEWDFHITVANRTGHPSRNVGKCNTCLSVQDNIKHFDFTKQGRFHWSRIPNWWGGERNLVWRNVTKDLYSERA